MTRHAVYWSQQVERRANAIQARYGVTDEEMEALLIATLLAHAPGASVPEMVYRIAPPVSRLRRWWRALTQAGVPRGTTKEAAPPGESDGTDTAVPPE